MTRLPYSEDLYQLLRRVHENLVVHHGTTDVHPPGYSWHGADMSPVFQDLCADARHAGLLKIGVHESDGCAVSLTTEGVARLVELRARHRVTP